MEEGERPKEALQRELIEELGVDIGIVESNPFLHLSDADAGLDLTVWVVAEWRGKVENRRPDEHDDVGWFELDDLHSVELADGRYLSLLETVLVGPPR